MKKTTIIHFIWAVVAIVAFVLGSRHFPKEQGSAGSEPGDGPVGRYAQSGGGPQGGEARYRRSSRTNRVGGAEVSTGARTVNLSAKGIKSLGNILRTSTDPVERRIAFSKLLEGLTVENAESLRQEIIHMSDNSSEWKDFHYAWGALAGQKVVEFGKKSQKTDMAAAFSGWASANPHAAMAWLQAQDTNERGRNDLKWGAVYGLANADPQLATDYVSKLLENGDNHASNMMQLVTRTVLRSSNPVAAAQWSVTVPEGKLRDVAVTWVAASYAREKPLDAVNWLTSMPEGKAQSRGLHTAYSKWAARDPEAAGKHLNSMPSSAARDSAVNGYSRRIAYNDPNTAVQWASTITDPTMRNESLVHSGRLYLRRDADAARQWLANSHLPEKVHNKIIGKKKKK